MTKLPIKAIFFDLDETLVENHIPVRKLFPTVFFNFVDQIGEEHKHVFFEHLQTQVNGLWLNMFAQDIAPEQQLVNCFIKALNKTRSISAIKVPSLAKQMVAHSIDLASNNVEMHEGAIETLEELRRHKLAVGLTTNGMDSSEMGKIRTVGIEPYFDNITISAEARVHKPEKPIFDLALSRANANADQAWFVGDHITNDIAGAVRAGLHAIYYNPTYLDTESSFANVVERPDYTIHSLPEILEYL